MTALDVMLTLARAGVSLRADGDLLRWSGPEGAVTAALLAGLKEHKPEILALLDKSPARRAELPLTRVQDPDLRDDLRHRFEERAAIAEFVGNATRGRAERVALDEIEQLLGIPC